METFFIPSSNGARFCVHHPTRSLEPNKRGVVFVHAFAEEMNKSRHVVAQAARRLAAMGVGVFLIDLFGCGDSEGRFEDATWEDWQDDIDTAINWMLERQYGRLMLWGMRAGALLAAEMAVKRSEAVERCMFWQPTVSGEALLTQFLRLRVANAMLTRGAEPETTKRLRARLDAGEAVEVAGYRLAPRLAAALASRNLESLRPPCPVQWFEVVTEAGSEPAQSSQRVVTTWRAKQTQVTLTPVAGENFWGASNAGELVQCTGLVDATAGLSGAWQ